MNIVKNAFSKKENVLLSKLFSKIRQLLSSSQEEERGNLSCFQSHSRIQRLKKSPTE